MTTTYVTVAIPYVNAAPHLGYAYELIQADIYARARRAAGDDVRFLGGTDDYSLKNVLAAEAAGAPTRPFVQAHADRFEALAGPLRLSFDDFIRTSADARHIPAVERLWRAAATNGDLYRRAYEGDYCVGCEQFYSDDDLLAGLCPEHGTPTERVAEENWFFRLSRYQEHLEEVIASDRLRVRPQQFRNEVLAFVRRGLTDISVSRSVERARGWGVPVPGDPGQVVYVWFDALANYISSLRYADSASGDYHAWWVRSDERVHVVGKGILRFHAVYWPAFLASAGEPLPTRIQVHPYLTVGGAKLSKSSGEAVDPAAVVADYGADALRWWCARDVASVSDTDFTIDRLVARANEDLAGGLGNVTNRIVTLLHRYCDGRIPEVEVLPATLELREEVRAAITDFDLRGAAQHVVDAVNVLNRDLEVTAPWTVAKDVSRRFELEAILGRQARALNEIAVAVAPIVPDLAHRVQHQLGRGGPIPKPEPVFQRIDTDPPTPTRRQEST